MNSDVQGQEKAADPLAHGERGRGRRGGGREGERGGGEEEGGGGGEKNIDCLLAYEPRLGDWVSSLQPR